MTEASEVALAFRTSDSRNLLECNQSRGERCHPGYETPYQAFRVCLGPEKAKHGGRNYESWHAESTPGFSNSLVFCGHLWTCKEPLELHLRDRHPLSVHLKIDVEGAKITLQGGGVMSKDSKSIRCDDDDGDDGRETTNGPRTTSVGHRAPRVERRATMMTMATMTTMTTMNMMLVMLMMLMMLVAVLAVVCCCCCCCRFRRC